MIDLDSRTVMLRELAFHNGTLDVVNDDTQAFEAVYGAVLNEAERISKLPVPTPLRPRTPERLQAAELLCLDDAAFVENAYLRILHRDADEAGGSAYLLKLRNGELTKDDIILTLRLSREGERVGVIVEGARISRGKINMLTKYKGCRFVENAYNWVLGRRPSDSEVKLHLDLLEKGLSKRELLDAFADSPERGDMHPEKAAEPSPAVRYGDLVQYDDAEFVVNAYRRILDRQADPESASNYLAELREGKLTKGEILFNLRASEEGLKKDVSIVGALAKCIDVKRLLSLEDREFVCAIYMWVFGRIADKDGLNHNQRLLRRGMGKAELLTALLESPEAKGKPIVRFIKSCLDSGESAPSRAATITPEMLRRAEADVRLEIHRAETMKMLEDMRARLEAEIDTLRTRDAAASIQVCVAQRQAAVARQQAEEALGRLAEAQRQIDEQRERLDRCAAGRDGGGT